MQLTDVAKELGLEVRCAPDRLDRDVRTGYASDLLSDVIANTQEGDVWVTLQIHQNIVAVASMRELAGIIIVNGRQPEADTIEKAEAENIPIMVSPLPAFELIGKLHVLGISGTRDAIKGA